MFEIALAKADTIGERFRGTDLFLTASSFEPRSVRCTTLLQHGVFARAVIFNYQDTLDTVLGQENTRQMRVAFDAAGVETIDVLPCRFSEPYGAVRALHAFVCDSGLQNCVETVFVDITCFTKLHLLTLLRYVQTQLGARSVAVAYTEPLLYASAFGKSLSYGVDKTVYLPYAPSIHRSRGIGLLAFLGHERVRLECIIQELEPDVSVIVLGEPGFARDMEQDSRRINDSLIHRATYDRQYRLVKAPARDPDQAQVCLEQEVNAMVDAGCDTVYLAPLGTKVQALAIDMLRRSEIDVRMLLAYTIPKRYERRLYSQGSGPTYCGVLYGSFDNTV